MAEGMRFWVESGEAGKLSQIHSGSSPIATQATNGGSQYATTISAHSKRLDGSTSPGEWRIGPLENRGSRS